jgi:hypothetical protein
MDHISHARDEMYPAFLRTTKHPITLSAWRDHDSGGYAATLALGNHETDVRFAHAGVFVQELCNSIAAMLLTRKDPVDFECHLGHLLQEPEFNYNTTPDLEVPDPDLVELDMLGQYNNTTPDPEPAPEPEQDKRWYCTVS